MSAAAENLLCMISGFILKARDISIASLPARGVSGVQLSATPPKYRADERACGREARDSKDFMFQHVQGPPSHLPSM